jgi:hypothetical protein
MQYPSTLQTSARHEALHFRVLNATNDKCNLKKMFLQKQDNQGTFSIKSTSHLSLLIRRYKKKEVINASITHLGIYPHCLNSQQL